MSILNLENGSQFLNRLIIIRQSLYLFLRVTFKNQQKAIHIEIPIFVI